MFKSLFEGIYRKHDATKGPLKQRKAHTGMLVMHGYAVAIPFQKSWLLNMHPYVGLFLSLELLYFNSDV